MKSSEIYLSIKRDNNGYYGVLTHFKNEDGVKVTSKFLAKSDIKSSKEEVTNWASNIKLFYLSTGI